MLKINYFKKNFNNYKFQIKIIKMKFLILKIN